MNTSYGNINIYKFWGNIKFGLESECWEWQGNKWFHGYGRFYISRKGKQAHRISYELFYNVKIPKHLFACHHCDNKLCCNPYHIFLGTCKDNLYDAAKKGRMASGIRNGSYTHPESRHVGDKNISNLHPEIRRGENNGNSKLKWEDVIKIRSSSESQRKLAKKYNVSCYAIWAIKNRLSWNKEIR